MACPKSILQAQGGFPSKFLFHLKSRHFCISSCPVCSSCSQCCSSGPCLTLTISHHTGQALTRITKSSAHLLTIWAPFPRLEYCSGTMALPVWFAGFIPLTSQRGDQNPQKYVPPCCIALKSLFSCCFALGDRRFALSSLYI